MQLGFVSAILPDSSFRQVMEAARSLGYECVEIMCWPMGQAERRYAGVTHMDVAHLTADRISEIHDICGELNVRISGLGYYPNPLAPDEEHSRTVVEHLRKVIQAAHQLGVGICNTFIGRDWNRSVDDNWPRFVDVWRPLVKFAEDHGVRIGIENCPMLFSRDEWPGGKNLAVSPVIWRRMFDAIPNRALGLNFDPSHFVWQHMDYLAAVREFSDRLVHIHAKDAQIDRNRLNEVGILALPTEFHEPKLPGDGEVHWGPLFTVLAESGYQGSVCVEVEDRAYEGSLESRLEGLRRSHGFMRQFLPR